MSNIAKLEAISDMPPKRYKHPRTPHLPWSPGKTADDKTLFDLSHLIGQEIVITEKMDGENTTIYYDGYCHARSVEKAYHWSRSRVLELAAVIAPSIPKGLRICGENMVAVHAIEYKDLSHYFLVHSIWKDEVRLPHNDTLGLCKKIGLTFVPILFKGMLPEKTFYHVLKNQIVELTKDKEGYVLSRTQPIMLDRFPVECAKYVRANHVFGQHWQKNRPHENNWEGKNANLSI